MLAVITGASSGIGRDMANILSQKGYDLVLIARRREKMEELHLPNCRILCYDLSKETDFGRTHHCRWLQYYLCIEGTKGVIKGKY